MADFPNSSNPAISLVSQAHNKYTDYGTQTYNLAMDNLRNLSNISLTPAHFNVSFDFDGQLAAFQRPNRPDINWDAFEFRDPGVTGVAPSFDAVPLVFDPAPESDIAPPTLTFGAKPTAPDINVPIAPAPAPARTMPSSPDYILPEVPTMMQLQLPDVPDVHIPLFDMEAPVFIEPPFQQDWNFDPQAYTSQLLDQLTAKLGPMIQGQEALPPAIVASMFERNRSRIEVETNRAVEQAISEFAARGFSEPNGVLNGRVLEVRQTGQNALAEASREVVIEQHKEALTNLRFAITQGAALEGVTINLHTTEQAMLLQAATFQRDSVMAVLNYRVSVHNMKLETYRVEASVLRDRIQAELAKVEIFRAQLEGERMRGEINDQNVRIYTARLDGIKTMADFYRIQVDTVKVQADIDKADIERYKIEVDAYGERWKAHVAEWQGYSAGVEGEGKRADLYKTMIEASTERTRAWSLSQNMKVEAEKLHIAQHGQEIVVWDAGLRQVESRLQGERSRLAAVAAGVGAQAQIYTADANVEQAASAATDRSFELGLSAARAEVETQLRRAEMLITQTKGMLDQKVELAKAMAQISAQLAASTMSAVSYSANVGYGSSDSYSRSTSFSFSGEIADAAPGM